MKKWHRIPDDETAQFGNVSWKFEFPEGNYRLIVNQSEQNYATITYKETTEHWDIQFKEQKGSEFKLSGIALTTPEIMLEESYWFELLISSNPKITYWGDRVIIRTDLRCQPHK